MHHGKLLVGREVDVELDHIRASSKSRVHRGQGVLDEVVSWRVDTVGRAGVGADAVLREGLVHAAVGDQLDSAATMRALPPGRVVEDDGEDEGGDPAEPPKQLPDHRSPSRPGA